MPKPLNHFDDEGNARMVDVGDKDVSRRMASARGAIRMKNTTAEQIRSKNIKKGDVLAVARIAGISGAKWTPHLIPMCHPIGIDSVDIQFDLKDVDSNMSELEVVAIVSCTGRTGVEMEALTSATTTMLTVYDMCKSLDREMEFREVHLIEKSGGKSGHYVRQDHASKESR